MHESEQSRDSALIFRAPRHADVHAIHHLVSECPPLDLNSLYAYLLLAEHFSSTCVLALTNGNPQGFVSAYLPPGRSDVLFVWQVAVHHSARGRRLARLMLQELLARPNLEGIRYIETTVSPGNRASRKMFEGLAAALHTSLHETSLFGRHLFGGQAHDEEPLLRIGPFHRASPLVGNVSMV
ncbi:diaminobutyrate acetyltransferase [Alcaligenaceae bacterium]|nr:diaminobutyrate acetyltransferase [Alcaligenaceae bacterium]